MPYGARTSRPTHVLPVTRCALVAGFLLTACAPERPSVDDVFAHFDVEGSPGAVVMVIRDGEVLHSSGYGAADLESASPMSPSTPVRLASVSKAFTAMAIVLLEQQGSLDFDARATEWIPELARFPDVTVRHLLQHTSGLPDYFGEGSPLQAMGTSPDREVPLGNAEAVSVYRDWGEPVSVPGERFAYSNPGYEILALIVERVSGVTFGEFLDTEIFTPLGMETAVVRDLPTTVIPGRAVGYAPEDEGEGWRERDDHWANWLVGAGGIYASAEDMYKWDQALHGWAESGDRTNEAFERAVLNDGTVADYGFGWRISELLDRSAIFHDGGWVGFSTSFLRFAEDGLSVIVLSNASGNAPELAKATAELYIGES